MTMNNTPTAQLFIRIYTHDLTDLKNAITAEMWEHKYGELTPEQVALDHVREHSSVYQAFVLGLGCKEDPTPDTGIWHLEMGGNPREVYLHSDDFQADASVKVSFSGDFSTDWAKYSYANRMMRALNRVALQEVPGPATDQLLGYVHAVTTLSKNGSKQSVFGAYQKGIPDGTYAVYGLPVTDPIPGQQLAVQKP